MSALYEIVEALDHALAIARERAASLPADEAVDIAITDIMAARRGLVEVEGRIAMASVSAA